MRASRLMRVWLGLTAIAAALAAVTAPTLAQPPTSSERVVLVTLDGARTEELFGGIDVAVARSTLAKDGRLESHPVFGPLLADTPEARRQKLMPFLWGTLLREHGSIAGNRTLGSAVTLTNRHRFSYPGYSEILVGEAHDDVIDSNDPVRNPYPTVLEGIRTHRALPASGVGVFASWNVFDAIVEHTEGALTVNSGYQALAAAAPDVAALSRLQFETRTPWDSVRHDAYTFRFAMAHLREARPAALYLALGETDDWAHDGRYDRVLQSYQESDRSLGELWTWLQNDPEYRGHTHLLITTDHGRGHTVDDWRKHGEDVEGAQEVWMVLASPSMTRRGEWRDHAPLFTNQIAATLAAWVGLDWRASHPSAGPAIKER